MPLWAIVSNCSSALYSMVHPSRNAFRCISSWYMVIIGLPADFLKMGNKKAHGLFRIHALCGGYLIIRGFETSQKGKSALFTSTKLLVKILAVRTAKTPILSGFSRATSIL